MAFEEKSTWVFGVVSIAAYTVYLVLLFRAPGALPEVDYVPLMLWTIGGAIVGAIILNILVGIFSPKADRRKDARDREIYRSSEYGGQSFLVIGGVAALILAMLDVDTFWIANVLFLCFILSALLSVILRIVAYRRGF